MSSDPMTETGLFQALVEETNRHTEELGMKPIHVRRHDPRIDYIKIGGFISGVIGILATVLFAYKDLEHTGDSAMKLAEEGKTAQKSMRVEIDKNSSDISTINATLQRVETRQTDFKSTTERRLREQGVKLDKILELLTR